MLRAMGQVDLLVKLCYVVFLGIIGGLMFIESLRAIRRTRKPGAAAPRRKHNWVHNLPFKMKFRTSGLYISVIPPVIVGILVGILAAIMGVGGGFIMVPAMIYLLGMPTKVVVGTSLFQIIFVTAFTTLMHATTNYTVDMMLAVLLLIGGVIGAQIGTRIGVKMKAEQLRILLALIWSLRSAASWRWTCCCNRPSSIHLGGWAALMLRAVLILLVALAQPLPRRGGGRGRAVSQNRVAITANFDGSEILIFGAVKREAPIARHRSIAGDHHRRGPVEADHGAPQGQAVRHLGQHRRGRGRCRAPVSTPSPPVGPLNEVLNETEDLRYKISIPRAIRSVGAPMTIMDSRALYRGADPHPRPEWAFTRCRPARSKSAKRRCSTPRSPCLQT